MSMLPFIASLFVCCTPNKMLATITLAANYMDGRTNEKFDSVLLTGFLLLKNGTGDWIFCHFLTSGSK